MPKETVALLEKLLTFGFSDRQFRILHHQGSSSIRSMIRYCEKTAAFRANDNNERARERLRFVHEAVKRLGRIPTAGDLEAAARQAVQEIPFDRAGPTNGVMPPEPGEIELLDQEAEEELRQRKDIGPTEAERLVRARLGQGVFLDNVIRIDGLAGLRAWAILRC